MTDFTSALYLGIEHGSRHLAGWDRLTLGKPAALESPPGAAEVEQELAALTGCERALVAASTLHVFHDLLPIVCGPGSMVFVDDCLYPIARWGVERAATLGTPAMTFRRHDVRALWRAVKNQAGRRPIVVADGFCPSCGTPAPIGEYVACAASCDGLVVLDDTQALGIFGRAPGPAAPYGSGGGGSLSRAQMRDRRVILVGSLAKAFGAPLAVVAGSGEAIADFERRSATRVHCSPPSAASIAAAAHALWINRADGDALRARLAHRVARLRRGLGSLASSPGVFPVQYLRLPARIDPVALHAELWNRGIQTVLSRGNDGRTPRIGFVLTARHEEREIDRALTSVAELTTRTLRRSWGGGSGHGKWTDELRAFWSGSNASS